MKGVAGERAKPVVGGSTGETQICTDGEDEVRDDRRRESGLEGDVGQRRYPACTPGR